MAKKNLKSLIKLGKPKAFASDLNKFSSQAKVLPKPENVDLFDLVKRDINPQIIGDDAPNSLYIRKTGLFTYVWNATNIATMGNEMVGDINFPIAELDNLAGARVKSVSYSLALQIDDAIAATQRAVIDSCDMYWNAADGVLACGQDGVEFEYNGSPIINTLNSFTANLRLRFDRRAVIAAADNFRYFVYLAMVIEFYP